MIYTDLTKNAMRIAFDAHYGEEDRGKVPYICHPLHLAEEMPDELTTVIALLHDVLEDTELTEKDLSLFGFPKEVTEAVRILTRDKKTHYARYIENIIRSGNEAAMYVKLADLRHNMDETRAEHGKLPSYLIERYRLAYAMIEEALKKMTEGERI